MFDSLPHNSPALYKVGGGKPAAKVRLNAGLTPEVWDSIFGPGSHDAVAAKTRTSPSDCWTRQGWFRKCCDTRAKAVQTMPWGVYRAEAGPGDYDSALWTEQEPDAPDELAALRGLVRCLYLAESSLSLAGRAYFGKVLDEGMGLPGSSLGRFERLAYWSPYTVEPTWERGRFEFRRVVNAEQRYVEPEAVVYAWQPDPLVEFGPGSSDGNAAAHNAAVLDSLSRFLGDHLDNGLVKMTVLTAGDGARLTEEQASKAGRYWWDWLRGKRRRQGPPVIGNVTPHVIGEGLKDLANEVLTKEQRQAISTAFGIPWSVLSSESANYATAQVEERGFYIRTVIPQARLVERALNEHLLKEYGYRFQFEPERHEVMQQFELEKAEKLALLVDRVYTRQEARQLMGLEPEPAEGMGAFPSAPVPVGDDGRPDGMAARSLDRAPLRDRIAQIVGGV